MLYMRNASCDYFDQVVRIAARCCYNKLKECAIMAKGMDDSILPPTEVRCLRKRPALRLTHVKLGYGAV